MHQHSSETTSSSRVSSASPRLQNQPSSQGRGNCVGPSLSSKSQCSIDTNLPWPWRLCKQLWFCILWKGLYLPFHDWVRILVFCLGLSGVLGCGVLFRSPPLPQEHQSPDPEPYFLRLGSVACLHPPFAVSLGPSCSPPPPHRPPPSEWDLCLSPAVGLPQVIVCFSRFTFGFVLLFHY